MNHDKNDNKSKNSLDLQRICVLQAFDNLFPNNGSDGNNPYMLQTLQTSQTSIVCQFFVVRVAMTSVKYRICSNNRRVDEIIILRMM